MAPKRQPNRRCIPVGCLALSLPHSNIPSGFWNGPELKTWSRLVVGKLMGEAYVPDPSLAKIGPLESNLQQYVLGSLDKRYVHLFQKRWIELAIRSSLNDPGQCILRVYLLPDDIDRGEIDRSDERLQKARVHLLSQLDFSPDTWQGNANFSPLSPSAYGDDDVGGDQEQTLLAMFNNIPEPNPQLERIEDPYARDSAYELLGDDVVGLKTELRSYQQRSAAAMLERESQPYRTLDPRLVKVPDQTGQAWYYDRVNGFGLLEPRYYDGVNGGILAEEMGAGKTLICLALILATKHRTSQIPDIYRGRQLARRRVGSLADMAAANITMNALPWKPWFETEGLDYQHCREYLQRNPGHYHMPGPERRKHTRQPVAVSSERKVYLSHATLVLVPGNLVQQWRGEIGKHTAPGSLRTIVITGSRQKIPSVAELIETDIILFSHAAFQGRQLSDDHPLTSVHFKRCIIDEGHRIGSSTPARKSDLLVTLDSLQISARWVVSGTPAKGLFGVEDGPGSGVSRTRRIDFSDKQEKEDLKAIGNITTLYLKARPWAKTFTDYGDRPADWSVYVLQPKHSRRSTGRKDCLRATLDSLIIRHRRPTVGESLPETYERVVYLDGSYQDNLCLNLFSMNIIINAVTSQRTDQDYFFHPRSRTALLQLVDNLRQASFFGGAFYSPEEITQTIKNATNFLEERKFPISEDDAALIREAIAFGQRVEGNTIKHKCSYAFREIPVYVRDFPAALGEAWSLDEKPGDPVCTNAFMIEAMQRFLRPVLDAPHSLQLLFDNGKFEAEGRETRARALVSQTSATATMRSCQSASAAPSATKVKGQHVAQEAKRGTDRSRTRKLTALGTAPLHADRLPFADQGPVADIAEPLKRARIISTASAKMSYLLDQVAKYQNDEKILIFYETNAVAWYVSYLLQILDVEYLIYSRTIPYNLRAQYATTFNQNPKFRVMLMDISIGAFGVDLLASRVYFINPVLDPQVEAQAIGRARRTSQKKSVTVETLVLRGSLEELILRRREEMTPAEQRKCKSILDDKPIYEWVLNAKILPFPDGEVDGLAQTAMLQEPRVVFGLGSGRTIREDEGLVPLPKSPVRAGNAATRALLNQEDGTSTQGQGEEQRSDLVGAASALMQLPIQNGLPRKRTFELALGLSAPSALTNGNVSGDTISSVPSRRVRFAGSEED